MKRNMFKREKSDRMSIFRSKYMDLDIENMSDEEFSQISKKVYISIATRSIGSIILLILCIIGFIVGGKYGW